MKWFLLFEPATLYFVTFFFLVCRHHCSLPLLFDEFNMLTELLHIFPGQFFQQEYTHLQKSLFATEVYLPLCIPKASPSLKNAIANKSTLCNEFLLS
jgi:hypothetical protein